MKEITRSNGHTGSRFFRTFTVLLVPIAICLVIRNSGFAQADPKPGILKLSIVDADSGQPTRPALSYWTRKATATSPRMPCLSLAIATRPRKPPHG